MVKPTFDSFGTILFCNCGVTTTPIITPASAATKNISLNHNTKAKFHIYPGDTKCPGQKYASYQHRANYTLSL